MDFGKNKKGKGIQKVDFRTESNRCAVKKAFQNPLNLLESASPFTAGLIVRYSTLIKIFYTLISLLVLSSY